MTSDVCSQVRNLSFPHNWVETLWDTCALLRRASRCRSRAGVPAVHHPWLQDGRQPDTNSIMEDSRRNP